MPTNSSISVTLSQDDLKTTTTATASAAYTEDNLWLNGKREEIEKSKRTQTLLRELRRLRAEVESKDSSLPPLSTYKLHVGSYNNFPTAAGLASSAAGFAALVKAIATLYELPLSDEELSVFARQGSGSACRSMLGGYVAWEMGFKADGSDSKAVVVAERSHWPQMRAAILVASDKKKDTSSTTGMQVTVKTSTLFKERVDNIVPKRFEEMKKSIVERDFASFARLTMVDSNQFHAVCLDSEPPIFYMNDASRAAIRTVEEINRVAGATIAAYTFDAGPNCVVYYLAENEEAVLGPLRAVIDNDAWAECRSVEARLPTGFDPRFKDVLSANITRVILTSVGDGPAIVNDLSLINDKGEYAPPTN